MPQLKPIQNIHISARRWFQSTYGNTYHSVNIFVNDDHLHADFEYGYGDGFLNTAQDLLTDHGYDLQLPDGAYLTTRHLREELNGTYSVADVKRKRDL